jgi:tetratricopeptide (TPR) repeat protein
MVCRQILSIKPDHRESHRRLIFFYAMTQQQVAMQNQIQAAILSECELPEAFIYGFLGEGLQLRNGPPTTERWMESAPQNEILLVARAIHFANSVSGAIPVVNENESQVVRDFQDQRVSKLEELLQVYPKNCDLQAYLLKEYVQRGELLGAGELLTHAIAQADEDFRFWHARGWVFAKIQEYEEAERCYQRALLLNPLDWRTRFHFSELKRAMGRSDEAIAAGQLAIDGRGLEREMLQQTDILSVPDGLFRRLLDYSQHCGAKIFTRGLQKHLRATAQPSGNSAAE